MADSPLPAHLTALNPLTTPIVRPPDHQLNPAKWTYERLARSIIDFEEDLDQEHEIGARLVSFNATETFHIDDIGYWGPDIIIFYGVNCDGNDVTLIQHYSQMNVLLVALRKEAEEPRRIGFALEARLRESDEE